MLRYLNRMRDAGWIVANHNDYYTSGGTFMTFYAFTDAVPGATAGRLVKGWGKTDASALWMCIQAAGLDAGFAK